MKLIEKQVAKLAELEAKRERMRGRISRVDMQIIELEERIALHWRKKGLY